MMKKIVNMITLIATMVVFILMIANPLWAQTDEQKILSSSIPENVAQVLHQSCIHCHMEPGNPMAMTHVNLGKWDDYSASKQASKAAAMSKMLNKGKMPPKKFRADNPHKLPSDADVKVISDWAKSLKSK